MSYGWNVAEVYVIVDIVAYAKSLFWSKYNLEKKEHLPYQPTPPLRINPESFRRGNYKPNYLSKHKSHWEAAMSYDQLQTLHLTQFW